MRKFVKIYFLILVFVPAVYLVGCSSGEYDTNSYKVDYVEKEVKYDTSKKITLDDKIKEDKNVTKDSYTYVVQIGAFMVKSYFERFYEIARQTLGDEVYYEQSNYMYKIRIGSYNTRAEAIKYMEFVRSKGYNDAFVIAKKK
jgi:cell division protein FtsN